VWHRRAEQRRDAEHVQLGLYRCRQLLLPAHLAVAEGRAADARDA
jgi:hypothetical protein